MKVRPGLTDQSKDDDHDADSKGFSAGSGARIQCALKVVIKYALWP